MRMWKLGLILVTVGLIGGVVSYTSGLIYHSFEYYKMGIASNIIQIIGLVGITIDHR